MSEPNNSYRDAIGERGELPTCLVDLATDLTKVKTVEELSSTLVIHVQLTLNACVVVLALLAEDGSEFFCPRIEGYPNEVANTWRRFPANIHMPIPLAVQNDELVLLETLEERQSFYSSDLKLPNQVGRALAAIPFRQGEVIGAIGLTFPSDRKFQDNDRSLFRAVARLCAMSLNKVRLHGLGIEGV